MNNRLLKYNVAVAKKNYCGFTDRNLTVAKPKGIFRIGILGDSFVWGDGLHYEDSWNHKLESKLLQDYDSIEVLHWGTCGWSTRHEIEFYEQEGKDYNIDLLLVGWVDNDVDMWNVLQKASVPEKNIFDSICPPLARILANNKANHYYSDWMDSLYSDSNLKWYAQMLHAFNQHMDSAHVKTVFVMTPSPFYPIQEKRFEKLEQLIKGTGITCLNLYPTSQKALAKYTPDEQMANPVNGHPGVVMTEEFANEVKAYLEENHYL